MTHLASSYLSPLFDPNNFADSITKARHRLTQVNFDAIAVRGNSGAIFGGALALAMGKKLILVRKPNDGSHSYHTIEHSAGCQRWVFVDDLIGSGGTRRAVYEALEGKYPGEHQPIGQYLYIGDASGWEGHNEGFSPWTKEWGA